MSEISSPNALGGGITERPGRGALAQPSGRAASPERRPMRRSRWRLRILLAIRDSPGLPLPDLNVHAVQGIGISANSKGIFTAARVSA